MAHFHWESNRSDFRVWLNRLNAPSDQGSSDGRHDGTFWGARFEIPNVRHDDKLASRSRDGNIDELRGGRSRTSLREEDARFQRFSIHGIENDDIAFLPLKTMDRTAFDALRAVRILFDQGPNQPRLLDIRRYDRDGFSARPHGAQSEIGTNGRVLRVGARLPAGLLTPRPSCRIHDNECIAGIRLHRCNT